MSLFVTMLMDDVQTSGRLLEYHPPDSFTALSSALRQGEVACVPYPEADGISVITNATDLLEERALYVQQNKGELVVWAVPQAVVTAAQIDPKAKADGVDLLENSLRGLGQRLSLEELQLFCQITPNGNILWDAFIRARNQQGGDYSFATFARDCLREHHQHEAAAEASAPK